MRTYAGVVLAGPDGQLAVQVRDDRPGIANPGRVTTFGGLAEGDETALAAAARELWEELALTPEPGELREVLRHEKRDGDGRTLCLLYRLDLPDLRHIEVREGVGALVGTVDELLADDRLTDTCRRAVRAAAGAGRPVQPPG